MKRILDIGQCNHDHGLLSRLADSVGAQISRANTQSEAVEKLKQEKFDLIWVNRMLDADNTFGVDTIKAIKSNQDLASIPVMLISNFSQAQDDAIKVGAVKGFGKDHLSDADTLARVKEALG